MEGKRNGIETNLVKILGACNYIPITYAGGIGKLADTLLINDFSNGKLDFTIGSSLDIFGGNIPYKEAVRWNNS